MGTIQIETDGHSITRLRLTPASPAVEDHCLGLATIDLGDPVGGGSFEASGGLIVYATGEQVDLTFSGFIDQNGVASGVLRGLPGMMNSCATRDVTWAAVLRPGTAAPKGGQFSGTTDRQGAVSFSVSPDGATVPSVSVALPGGCGQFAAPGISMRLVDGVGSMTRSGAPDSINGRLVLAVSGDQALGVYATRSAGGRPCGPVVGTLTAKATAASAPASPAASPAASPTPGPSSVAGPQPAPAGVVGAVPAANSIGLLVTGGAMNVGAVVSNLGGRGCSVSSLGILRDGAWTMFVAGAPAIVNLPFPDALPASTPFFVRCN
jgi:hypothetical protein